MDLFSPVVWRWGPRWGQRSCRRRATPWSTWAAMSGSGFGFSPFQRQRSIIPCLPISIWFSSPAFQFSLPLALVGHGLEGESEKNRKQNLSLSSLIECSALTCVSETDSHEVKVKVFSFIPRWSPKINYKMEQKSALIESITKNLNVFATWHQNQHKDFDDIKSVQRTKRLLFGMALKSCKTLHMTFGSSSFF